MLEVDICYEAYPQICAPHVHGRTSKSVPDLRTRENALHVRLRIQIRVSALADILCCGLMSQFLERPVVYIGGGVGQFGMLSQSISCSHLSSKLMIRGTQFKSRKLC